MPERRVLFVSMIAAVLAIPAWSDVVYTNMGSGYSDSDVSIISPNVSVAKQFTVTGSGPLASIRLPLSVLDAGADLAVSLRVPGADPNGAVLESWTVPAASLSATPMVIVLTSTLHPALIAGTSYWLRLDAVISGTYQWHQNIIGEFGNVFSVTAGAVWETNPESWSPALEVNTPPARQADSPYKVTYLANLNIADSYINIANVGTISGNDPAGRICANIYVFDPNEEPVSCCACPVTPSGLVTLSARSTLISNPVTAGVPTSLVVKVLFTAYNGSCDAGALPTPAPLPVAFPSPAEGMLTLARGGGAWSSTSHANTSTGPATYSMTEIPFENAELSPSEYYKIVYICNFIQTYASKYGLCKGCHTGHMGASPKF